MKPGKPIAHGTVQGTPFIGLRATRFRLSPPSACCAPLHPALPGRGKGDATQLLVARSLRLDQGRQSPRIRARRLEPQADGAPGVVIYPNQGSGVLTSAVWGEGLAEIREGTTVAPRRPDQVHPF